MAPHLKNLITWFTLFITTYTGVHGTFCGEYQRKFCLRPVMIYVRRGAETYGGLAKLGDPMVQTMCDKFNDDTMTCFDAMKPHCTELERAELQGTVDKFMHVCDAGRQDLYQDKECLSRNEHLAFPCRETYIKERGATNVEYQLAKISLEEHDEQHCNHLRKLEGCTYNSVVRCTGATWLRQLSSLENQPLKDYYHCADGAMQQTPGLVLMILSVVMATVMLRN